MEESRVDPPINEPSFSQTEEENPVPSSSRKTIHPDPGCRGDAQKNVLSQPKSNKVIGSVTSNLVRIYGWLFIAALLCPQFYSAQTEHVANRIKDTPPVAVQQTRSYCIMFCPQLQQTLHYRATEWRRLSRALFGKEWTAAMKTLTCWRFQCRVRTVAYT